MNDLFKIKKRVMLVVVVISSCQAKTLDITSPDGNLVTVELAEEKGYGEIGFQWITR